MMASGVAGVESSVRGFVELARPGNVLMALVGVVVAAVVAVGDPFSGSVLWACLAVGLVTAGGNALNDVVDRGIDRGAHPGRPLPSGRVSVRGALGFACGVFVLGLVAGWLAGPVVFLVVLAAEGGLLVYEVWWKARGLVGNVVVGVLVGGTFVVGGLAVGVVSWPVGFLAGLAMLSTVGREVFKDAEDAVHDRGRLTLAHRWGVGGALWVGRGVTLLAVALSPLPLWVGFGGWPFGVLVGLACVVFLGSVVASSPGRAQRLSKGGMVLALVAFAVGGLV